MEKSICQTIRNKAKECNQSCPLLDFYAYKCDMLCIHNESLTECKKFLKIINVVIPKKTEIIKKNA